jgi:hypothetical protein
MIIIKTATDHHSGSPCVSASRERERASSITQGLFDTLTRAAAQRSHARQVSPPTPAHRKGRAMARASQSRKRPSIGREPAARAPQAGGPSGLRRPVWYFSTLISNFAIRSNWVRIGRAGTPGPACPRAQPARAIRAGRPCTDRRQEGRPAAAAPMGHTHYYAVRMPSAEPASWSALDPNVRRQRLPRGAASPEHRSAGAARSWSSTPVMPP